MSASCARALSKSRPRPFECARSAVRVAPLTGTVCSLRGLPTTLSVQTLGGALPGSDDVSGFGFDEARRGPKPSLLAKHKASRRAKVASARRNPESPVSRPAAPDCSAGTVRCSDGVDGASRGPLGSPPITMTLTPPVALLCRLRPAPLVCAGTNDVVSTSAAAFAPSVASCRA